MNFPVVYAVKHKNYDIRMESRSGGMFTALSDNVLKSGGVVYGCVMNGTGVAVHVRADNTAERNLMRGSKYIQSHMNDTFRNIKKDLDGGRKVLFSGTSCQVAGLKSFLAKDYGEQLICVDIVCHGVPSELVWQKYIEWQEKKNGGKCVAVDFRNKKKFGWSSHIETLTINSGGTEKKVDSDVFKELFYGHNILRPCCYKCPYKDIMHPADITIADYWGIEKAAPDFNDNKGVSLVLINNEKGVRLFESVNAETDFRECRIEDSMQPPLKSPFESPAERNKFWEDFRSKPFDYIAKKYGRKPLKKRIKQKLKRIKKKIMG
jgi:coenzyme F420-reducing hydrogenase beta subunit